MKWTLFLAGTCFGAAICAAAPINTTNLLTNPGAETGDLTGWHAIADSGDSASPGVDNGLFDSGIDPHSGLFDFYGFHSGGMGTLSQSVSLIGNDGITAADIDAGSLSATVSFWEQGLNQGTPSDSGQVTLLFLDRTTGLALLIGSVSTSVVDSHSNGWQFESDTFGIPAGTRAIAYQMKFIRNQGTNDDAFIDDNSLTIASPGASAVPEPSTFGLLFIALLGVGLFLKRRRVLR